MTIRNLVIGALALGLIFSLALVWAYPSSQDYMPRNPHWNGLKDFVDWSKADFVESLDGLADPQDEVLVSLPCSSFNTQDLNRIKTFVSEGGTLAVMDDFGYGNQVLEYLGIGTRFSQIELVDPLFNEKSRHLPKVVTFEGRLRNTDLGAVVLDRPTALRQTDTHKVLALSSSASFLDFKENGPLDAAEWAGPFPVAAEETIGKGNVIMISDASVVINGVLSKDDNLKFLQETLGVGEKQIIIDGSHIPKSALDRVHEELQSARKLLSNQYASAGLVVLVLGAILVPLWRQRKEDR